MSKLNVHIRLNKNWLLAKGDLIYVTNESTGHKQAHIVIGEARSGYFLRKTGKWETRKIVLANRVKRAYRTAKDFFVGIKWRLRR